MAAVGFGLASIIAGHERGWISHTDAYNQLLTTLNFIDQAWPYTNGSEPGLTHKNGFYYHFVDIPSWSNKKETKNKTKTIWDKTKQNKA